MNLILVPAYTHIHHQTEHQLRIAEEQLGVRVWRWFGHSEITRVRSVMTSEVLNMEDVEKIMFVDSDIMFDVGDMGTILSASDDKVVGGAYVRKAQREFCFETFEKQRTIELGGDKEDYIPVRYLGMGFTVIPMKLLHELTSYLPLCEGENQQTFYPFFRQEFVEVPNKPDRYRFLPEDYSFCNLVNEHAGSCLLATQPRLWHIGDYGYSWEDAGGKPIDRFKRYTLDITNHYGRETSG